MRFFTLLLFSMFSFCVQASTIVTVKPLDFKKEMQEIRLQGFDIAGVDLEEGTFDVVLPDNSKSYFKSQINRNVVRTKEIKAAPDSEYLDPTEVAVKVRDYASTYPGLVKYQVIGATHENRLILAMKISPESEPRQDKKTVLFNCAHHSREVMTVEVCMDIVDQLVTKYETDPKIKQWMDTLDIWVVPMLNMDGSAKVFSGSNMWRKNTRDGHGVDINRNYPYKWGACNGSSGVKSSDTYRGPSAGSEPETQALMNLVATIKPKFNISYHSYSELVIYPEGCRGNRASEQVVQIGKELASKLKKDTGSGTYAPGTAYELLYQVDGGDIDWMYNAHEVMPFVIEVNSSSQGFQPSYSRWRDKTIEGQRPGWQFILDKALELYK